MPIFHPFTLTHAYQPTPPLLLTNPSAASMLFSLQLPELNQDHPREHGCEAVDKSRVLGITAAMVKLCVTRSLPFS